MADEELSGLLDPVTGRPIPRSVIALLRQEVFATDAAEARPPFAGHLATRMRPERLGAVIRAADGGSSQEWSIIEEEIEELFPHYYAVLSKRRRGVCQLPITVHPAGDEPECAEHAEFVTDWLETGLLDQALFHITDAIGKGFSVHEIVWDSRPGRVRPVDLLFREKRFFEISWKDGETLWGRAGVAPTLPQAPEAASAYVELLPHKFLIHKHPSKSGLTIRAGLTRVVAFLWMYSMFTARDWAVFVQSYGLPMRVGRYGPEASPADKATLWRAVSSIAGDVAAIIPRAMEIEIVQGADRAAGATLFEKRMDWLDREVSKVVLGGTAGTDAIAGGHAVGREHRQTEADVERFDARLLAASITRQLIRPMIAFTFGPQEKYPKLQIGQPDQVPLGEFVAGVAAAVPLGLRVRQADIRERLGLSAPEDGDELLTPPARAAAPGAAAEAVPKPPAPGAAADADEEPEADAEDAASGDLQAQRGLLGRLLTLHAEASPELVEKLTDRLATETAGALAGMTATVRHAFDQASSLHDLADRLSRLRLPQREFAEAMARGMALGHLAGQAELLDEIAARRR